MVQFFRKNLFANSLLFLPYIFLVRIHSLLSPITYQSIDNQTMLTKAIFSFISNGLWQNISACFIIFIHALMINRMVIKHRLASIITLFPGLIYVIAVSFLPSFTFLSPALIANTFVLMALSQLFTIYKKPHVAGRIFNVGLLLGISILILPSYIYLIIITLIGQYILRSIKGNEIFQHIIGVLVTFFLFYSVLYLLDFNIKNEYEKYIPTVNFKIIDLKGFGLYTLIATIFSAFFVLFNYSKYTIRKSIQAHKKIDILYVLMLVSVLLILLDKNFSSSQALLYVIPLSVFIGINFINIKNHMIQELLHLAALGLLFALQFGWLQSGIHF